jgi:hypothetical protein
LSEAENPPAGIGFAVQKQNEGTAECMVCNAVFILSKEFAHMNSTKDAMQLIETFIYNHPVCEFATLTPDELIFSDK